ncbi:hypothetical protein V8G54_028280 [Vigna mungo]|uniref:Uncharacterized protein n=1 Tax=Vigna mungo TaxID=3915 RepID=A0AAQ3MR65_VIGMU
MGIWIGTLGSDLSDMVAMVLKARMRARSGLEPRFCQRPREEERNSPPEPLGLAMTVDRPPSVRRGLEGPPTRLGSLSPDSLAKVRHSEVSSMEWDSRTRPHSEQTVSPAEWSNTTSVCFLQSLQNASDIFFLLSRFNTMQETLFTRGECF